MIEKNTKKTIISLSKDLNEELNMLSDKQEVVYNRVTKTDLIIFSAELLLKELESESLETIINKIERFGKRKTRPYDKVCFNINKKLDERINNRVENLTFWDIKISKKTFFHIAIDLLVEYLEKNSIEELLKKIHD